MREGTFWTHQCLYVILYRLVLLDAFYRDYVLTHLFWFCSIAHTVAINPNGRNYASGAEDGYVRLHKFDKSYLDMTDPVPEADEEEKVAEE